MDSAVPVVDSASSNLLRNVGGLARTAAGSSSSDMLSFSPADAPPIGVLSGLVRLLQEQSIVDVAYSYRDQVRLLIPLPL